MDIIVFSISHNGRFVFRTDEMQGDRAEAVQATLVAKFPGAEGYKVQRETHPATFSTRDITEG